MSLSSIDVSSELVLLRNGEGFVLSKPKYSYENVYSLKSLKQQVFGICLLDVNSRLSYLNEVGASQIGIESPKECLGLTTEKFTTKEIARTVLQNDAEVLRTEKCFYYEENVEVLPMGENHSFLSIKAPLFSNDNVNVQGIVCISLCKTNGQMPRQLQQLHEANLLQTHSPKQRGFEILNDPVLTVKENQILANLIQGFTSKQIAKLLLLSPRTVEWHIDNMKYKKNVATKHELIQQYWLDIDLS